MFPDFSNYYYLIIALQGICVWHCIKKGTQQKWIWLIVFLPVVGCIVYFFSEVLKKNDVSNVQTGLGNILNPSGKIKQLEENLRFTDTFNNKVALADAYLANGQVDNAIALYEQSLTGNFTGQESVNMQLIYAYFEKQRFDDLIRIAQKVYTLPQFTRSRAHTLYAIALGSVGNIEQAEQEFLKLGGKYSNFEARYHYGLLLKHLNRNDDARKIFGDIASEASHLNSYERKNNSKWLNSAKEQLKSI